ncbi:MAG TPA: 50S ribosomal protein L4 [Phycisphaerae bacterium]|nr:50S ribosomal protein L4 [Phycisphaerae bacterium]HUU22478.1 50S ribosomal protein L4 [Phycisphaerae bacterium]
MLDVPVYNTDGDKIDTLSVDEARFGTTVNTALLKQAITVYEDARHPGTAATRGRGQVAGSTRKLFRQKGTGNARRGNLRTNIMRGGGVAFAKSGVRRRKSLPRKMRRKALDSAILAKLLGENLLVVDGLAAEEPRTRMMAEVLGKLHINRSCLLTLAANDENLYKSARNIPDVTVRVAAELNAYDVATRQKMLVTRDAMNALLEAPGRE